jgi:hypothetical protein
VDFRQPHEQQAAEIDPSQTRENSGPDGTPISAAEEVFTPAKEAEKAEVEPLRTLPLFPADKWGDLGSNLPNEYPDLGKKRKKLGRAKGGGPGVSASTEVAEEPAEIEAEAERPPASDTDASDGEVKNAVEPQVFAPAEEPEVRPPLGRINDRGELVLTVDEIPALKARLEAQGWEVVMRRDTLDCKPRCRKHTKPSQLGFEARLEQLRLWNRVLGNPAVKKWRERFDAEVVGVKDLRRAPSQVEVKHGETSRR